jgi:alkaline phosphatase D
VLWTRLAPKPLEGGGMPAEPVEVSWIVSEDEKMSRVVRKGREVAHPEWAHSVHVELSGLKPDRWYWYQFKCGSEVSPVGRTRTSPAPGSVSDRFRFAFTSCQHFEAGYFDAYRHIVRDGVDLIVHLGDYIYEGAGREKQVRRHVGGEIFTIDDYRNRHAQYKTDPALQLAHAAAPWVVTWDDHEVENNYAGEIPETFDVPPRQFLVRRAAAYQAYYEHMPLRRYSLPQGPDMQIYRRISFGNLAEFFVLDTRQYRSDQPCGDRRSVQCPDALSPKATLLGPTQRQWLFDRLADSTAQWKILAQQVMMARVDRAEGEGEEFSMDQWSGYEMERRKVLGFLQERKIQNPVVLTGDIHSNWANELSTHKDLECLAPVAAEFVGTSISAGGNGQAFPKYLDQTLAQNPCVKFHNTQRGYVHCELSPKQWRSDYRVVESVTVPEAPIQDRASFVLEAGSPKLQKA